MRVRILLEFLLLMPFPSLEYAGSSFSVIFLYLVGFGNRQQKWSGKPGGIVRIINDGKEMKHIGRELKSLLIHF